MGRDTRGHLRKLADDEGVTLDEEVARLVRAERQRRTGQMPASPNRTPKERPWLNIGADVVGNDAAGDVVQVDFGVPAGREPGFVRPATWSRPT
ncbi:MAG: hypothetical protein M3450_11470 [Actinomycetota bacterium]|nr:hypothetical protein [Actinomycetota bacterium]